MDADIIPFPGKFKPHPTPANTGPHYFCTRCDGATFRLFERGAIHCATCGASMRNLSLCAASDPAKS